MAGEFRSRAAEAFGVPSVRWVMAVSLTLLLVLWGVSAAYIAYDRKGLIRESGNRAAASVGLLTAHANRTFESARASLSVLDAWLMDEHYALPTRPLSSIQEIMDRLRSFDGFQSDARLFDADGNILDLTTGQPSGQTVTNREFYDKLKGAKPGQIIVGAPFKSRYTGMDIIPVVTPANPNRHGVAYVGIGIPTVMFSVPYRNALPGPDGVSALFRDDAMMLARAPSAIGEPGKRYPRLHLFADGHAAGESGIYQADMLGRRWIAAYSTVPGFGLVIVSALTVDAALADWRHRVLVTLGLLLAGSAVVIYGCCYIARLFLLREAEFRRTQQALAAAAAANQAKGDFLAQMSHELHTPLNAILGFSEVIAGAVLGPLPAAYQDYGRDIHASGRHLLGLIDHILDTTLVESGRLRLVEEEVDLRQTAHAVLETLRQGCDMAGLDTSVAIPDDMRFIQADGRLVRRMLGNLMSNAVKFSNPGGRLDVSTRQVDAGLELIVADTGIGIEPGALAHIFEPFGRGDSLIARQAAGIGLGLADTKALIELHGGSIRVVSELGVGTRAILFFPAARMRQPEPLRATA